MGALGQERRVPGAGGEGPWGRRGRSLGQERTVPAQPPPRAKPTHPVGFAVPASSALLPRLFLGSPHPEHQPLLPQGAQRRSGNGFWLAPTEEFGFQGAMDGICCLLSPLRAVDSLTIGEGRGCWVGGEGAEPWHCCPSTFLPTTNTPVGYRGRDPTAGADPQHNLAGKTWGNHAGASASLDEVQPGYTVGETGTGMTQSPSQLVGATTLLGARLGKIHPAAHQIKQLHFR